MSDHRTKSFFQRHWIWAWPTGCMLPVVVLVGGSWLIVQQTASSIRGTDLYQMTVEKVRSDSRAIEFLGLPIELIRQPRGAVDERSPSGRGRITIPISGSKRTGYVRVEAKRENGDWVLTDLHIDAAENDKTEDKETEHLQMIPLPEPEEKTDEDQSTSSNPTDDENFGMGTALSLW